METSKSTFATCSGTALLATACLLVSLTAGEPLGGSSLAEREQFRRSATIQEARELLLRGDEAYRAGRYAEAVEAYAGARENIPDAPVSAELRSAATERYAQASVEHARALSRKGDVAGAKAAVDKVLDKSVAPNNPGALAFRAQLDDPIRTNPALTAQHAENVDSVRRLLYTAEGAYNLGKFDEANANYQKVLRIDPTNSAARRGMEKTESAKSSYHKASYDQTRAEMLSQVEAGWELAVPAAPDLDLGPDGPAGAFGPSGSITVSAKLDQLIIPMIALDQASLNEALDFLRVRTAEVDVLEPEPSRRGVNFTLDLGPPDSEIARNIRNQRFDLRLNQVPLSQVLKYLADITGTQFTTDEYSVIITPKGSTSDELFMRSYRVPPDFISNLSGASTGEADDDPFAEDASSGGLLTESITAQEALAKQGITFPDGAKASFSPGTSTLHVTTTAANHDIISQLVETISMTEPVLVAVRVTMISTQQTNLEELGFDWLVSPFPLNSQDSMFASGGTIGNTPGRTGDDFISPVGNDPIYGVPANPNAPVSSGVVTNGLRLGDQAIQKRRLEQLIDNPNRLARQASVAPGILGATGLFSDGQVQVLMRGLDQKKGTDIMAQPSTVTRSGQASNIEIVREFIYPTEYEPPELPNSVLGGFGGGGGGFPVTPATPTAFEMKKIGIELEVLPVADANRQYVDITLNPSITDFDGFVNYGSPINSTVDGLFGPVTTPVTPNAILMPIFSKKGTATQLNVADGSTIAFGGLLQETSQNVEDKVPVFGSMPLIGRFFSSKSRETVRTAVIFLVQIELLDPTGRPYRDR